jgi:hypothetical protein
VISGDDYASGEWTNSSVRVSATAETGASPITSVTWSMNGADQGIYTPGDEIFFISDGMNSGEFTVTDSLGKQFVCSIRGQYRQNNASSSLQSERQ